MRNWIIALIALCGVAAEAQAACTRPVLQAAVDSHLAAQTTGDRTKMAFTEKVKFLENMSEVGADKGLWNTGCPWPSRAAFSTGIAARRFRT